MFAGALGWFTKGLFGSSISKYFVIAIVALIAMIVLPNIGPISERLGFQTRAVLKEKVAEQKATINVITDANSTLAKSNNVLEKTGVNTEQAVTTLGNSKVDAEVKTTGIIEKRKENVAKVRAKPKTKDLTTIDPKLKLAMELSGESLERVEASKVNSLAIWEAYCNFNNDESCKTVLESGA